MKPWDSPSYTSDENITEFFLSDNPYMFFVNINHPNILPQWNKFKKDRLIRYNDPASDNERMEFEQLYIAENLRAFINWYNTDGRELPPEKLNRALEVINYALRKKAHLPMAVG